LCRIELFIRWERSKTWNKSLIIGRCRDDISDTKITWLDAILIRNPLWRNQ